VKSLFQRFGRPYRPLEIPDSEPNPLPIVGLALVVFALIQYIAILIPVDLGNKEWEFTVIGRMVDNSLTPILGMALFFYGRTVILPLWRLMGIRILTWMALILAIIYALMIPLTVTDTLRLNNDLKSKILAAENQAKASQAKVREALDGATSMEELEILTNVLNLTPSMAVRKQQMPSDSFIERREWLWETIRFNQNEILNQAFTLYKHDKASLFRDAAKMLLGCLIMSALYAYFFLAYRNVRKKHRIDHEA